MKLSTIGKICMDIIPMLEYKSVRTSQKFSKFQGVIDAVDILILNNLFVEHAKKVQSLKKVYNSRAEEITVDRDTFYSFINAVNTLKLLCEGFSSTIEKINPSLNELSISIKLPTINDLHDIETHVGTIHKIISQTILNKHVKGKLKVISIESGSYWINIFLGTELALTLFAGIVWAGAVIRKKIMEGNILREQLQSLKIGNQALTEIQKAQKDELDLLLVSEATNLVTSLSLKGEDAEFQQRIKHSIKLMSEIIEKGAEVHPALSAPEEVKNLLPNFKKLDSVISKIKLIDSGNTADD